MKKLIKPLLAFILISMAILFVNPAIAQETDPIKDWIGKSLAEFYVTLSAFAALVTVVSGYINRALSAEGQFAQIISWVIAVLGGVLGAFLNVGIFADLSWYWILITSVAGGLVANGLYDIEFVRQILALIGAILPKKKEFLSGS